MVAVAHARGRAAAGKPPPLGALPLAHAGMINQVLRLLVQSGRRQLMDAYTASQSRLKPACRRSEVSDFRTKSAVRLGEAPKLLLVPETGSVTTAGRAEAHEFYRAYTYARIFAITREALVNDDLGAFAGFTRDWGIAAASLEADVLANLLYGPSGVGPAMVDTLALFHSSHGNLAGAGATISDTTLSSARLAPRTMKGVDGVTLIEVAPRFLVVPAAIETTAEKYLASLYPSAAGSVNPFAQKLELIVEPRLDAKSATAWYVFGDPALAPVIEYACLGSAPGPQVDMQNGWAVLGAEFRCVLAFGAGVVDYRGAYRNPGA
jgi:Mu-like prophage major head subunit gpT